MLNLIYLHLKVVIYIFSGMGQKRFLIQMPGRNATYISGWNKILYHNLRNIYAVYFNICCFIIIIIYLSRICKLPIHKPGPSLGRWYFPLWEVAFVRKLVYRYSYGKFLKIETIVELKS